MAIVHPRDDRRRCYALPLLIVLLTVACGVALTHYGAPRMDEALLLWFRDREHGALIAGPAWVTSWWLAASGFGDVLPRVGIAVLSVLALVWLHRWRAAVWLAGVLLSGMLLSSAIKQWVARPRPQLVAHLDQVSSASFPSGHALNSTLFYLAIALLLAPLLRQRGARFALYGAAAGLSVLVGVARIALGVHYPSDVIASWAISGAWLWLWFAAAKHHWPNALR